MCRLPTSFAPYAAPRPMWIVLAGGLGVLTLMSLYIQFGLGAVPCQMCWWQRYVHYAVAVLACVGAVRPAYTRAVVAVSFPIACVGLGVAVWQVSAQQGWLPFPASCTSHGDSVSASSDALLTAMQHTKVIPCDRENFRIFGLTLATWNTPIMLGTLGWLAGIWALAKPKSSPYL